MPLIEVKEGMRGSARTVFRGSEPEEFKVEILGVLPGGVGPKQDLIIGRISGGSADRTAVFAGMSGSPVYINNRLVGAISYSFPFSKEPICGITPIEQMIELFDQNASPQKQPAPRAIAFAELAATTWEPRFNPVQGSSGLLSVSNQNSALMAVAGQTFQPIATPITFNGFSQETLDKFAPRLLQAGLLPVAAAGGAAAITPLKKASETTLVGGTSVSIQLTRGDFSLAAAGTVTLRDNNKIYAFGHPFLNLGGSDLPMSESHVVTVVPNINNSFKLAVPDSMVGSMTQDRSTGVFGTLGRAPKLIPVTLNVLTSRGKTETLKYEVAKDNFLTPLLLNITVYNSLIGRERGLGETTVTIDGEIVLVDQQKVKINRRFSGDVANQFAAASLAIPIDVLLSSSFENLEMSAINISVASVDGRKTAELDRISVDRVKVKAGETVEVQAYARTSSGQIFVQKIPVKIPDGTPTGPLSIMVGDGTAVQNASATKYFVPRNLSELVKTINETKASDRLYIRATRSTTGVIIGSSELPNLPPSVLATLNNDRSTGGIKPSVQSVIVESIVPAAAFIISGERTIAVEVEK